MRKTILITGATDGIGLETAKRLAAKDHHLLIHGRSEEKLATAKHQISTASKSAQIDSYMADLSDLAQVAQLANHIVSQHNTVDVIINNAGVLKASGTVSPQSIDIRIVVNTLAPVLLTEKLSTVIGSMGRIINVSSAAQQTVDINLIEGKAHSVDDMAVYAQSKLAITMWSHYAAKLDRYKNKIVVAVNPGSFLASKMVKEGYGIGGNDLGIGADILMLASLDDSFANTSGQYFDNDAGQFGRPHSDTFNVDKCNQVIRAIEAEITPYL